MTEQQMLLASAYLDEELTADERALVESDPDIMGLVDQLAATQQTMRVTTPVFAESNMSTQIRRALAEGNRTSNGSHQGAAPPPNLAPVVRLPQPTAPPLPSNNTRWLAVAAGVLAIGLLGALAVSALRTTNNDLTSGAAATSAAAMEESMAVATSTAMGADTTAVAADSATAAGSEGEMAPSMDGSFADDEPIVIANAQDLLEVGRQLLEPESLLGSSPRPETTCTVDDDGTSVPVLAEALLIEGQTSTPILIAAHLNASTSKAEITVYGVDPESCAVLMSTSGQMER